MLAPNSIQQNVGDLATSIFDLEVTDVVGIPITGSIPLGKKIQLKATMSDPTGELWFQVQKDFCHFGFVILL